MVKTKGLNKTVVKNISKLKQEPKWMTDFRLKAFEMFETFANPIFGPELKLDFNEINYFKRVSDTVSNKW